MTQPIDKAFKIMKNKQFANMGPTKPAAGNPQQQQFPESAPMPNSKQVQQLLLQMAQEKLQNPTYMQNMMEILQKPEGEDFARAAGREYENSYNEDVN